MKKALMSFFMFGALFSQPLHAGESCPDIKQSGTWSIPESAFTREEANRALKALDSQVNTAWEGAEWGNVENHLKRIKGYLYKVYLDGYRQEFGTADSPLRERFCKFLENEAFLEH